jgi:hypothetical protein
VPTRDSYPYGRIAGCACLPGATARPTLAPDGSPTIICQDGRLSFLNPGDRETESSDVLPDACAGFSCGLNGQCVAMNLTPTCVCDQGFVAVPAVTSSAALRGVTCVRPPEAVPANFYEGRLPPLPDDLPGGRQVAITEPLPLPDDGTGQPSTPDPAAVEPPGTFPMPRREPGSSRGSGGSACSIVAARPVASLAPWLIGLAFAALGSRRWRRTDYRPRTA